MSLICRTCLQVKPKFVNLFNHYDGNNAASEILYECTSVQIQKGDGLPLHICVECLETLITAWHFRKMTIETDGKLRQIFRKRTPVIKFQNKDSNDIIIVKEETIVKSEEYNPLTLVNECVNITDTNSVQINQENAISFMETDESSLSKIVISACNDKENVLPATCSNQGIESCNVQHLQHAKETYDVKQLQHVIENCIMDHNYASNYNTSTSIIDGQRLNKNFMINNMENGDHFSGLAISGNNIIQSVLPIEDQLIKNVECNPETPLCNENDKVSVTTNIDEASLLSESMDISYRLDEKRKSRNSYFVFQGIKDDVVQQESTNPEIVLTKDDNINNDKLNSKPKKLLVLGEYRKLTREELAKVSVRCRLCNKVFGYRYYHHVHLRGHKGDLPYKCNVCDKRFARQSLVKAHALMHSEARPFPCDRCEKTFKTVSALQKHKSVHSDDRPFKCDLCESGFKWESSLKLHKRRHENRRDQICETCGKTFIVKSELSSHMKSHSNVKNYLCTECGKAFITKSKLRVHFKYNHTNERPYVCDHCGRRFKMKCVMQVHSLIHTGERPHICHLCNKSFRQLVALRTHMRTHTGEAPYACKVCPSQFKYSQQLTNHMKYHK